MNHTSLLVAGAMLALTVPAAAQWPGDNFDSYADLTVLDNVGGWFGWDNTSAAAATVSSVRKLSAPHSLLCGPTTDAVHPDIGIDCGKWTVRAMQRITLGDLAGGDVFFILNNVYAHGGPYTWTVQISASNSTSMVDDDLADTINRISTPLPIVYDRWVEIRCEIDLDADTIDIFYDGALLSTGVYTINGGPAEIQNVDLFSTGGTCYFDDFSFQRVEPLNAFSIFNDAANTASRGNFGPAEGSLFQGYPPSHFAGIGDNGTTCDIGGFQYVIQDQNVATQDPYIWAVRSGTAAGPDLGAGGVIASYNLLTPFFAAGGGGAWFITLSLASPVTVPCDDHVFVGFQFPAFAGWPTTDGPSSQARTYAADAAFLLLQPHHAWQIVGDPDAGVVSQPSARSMSLALQTPCPVLNVGSVGATVSPDFGATGMYTDVGMPNALGLSFRVRDGANANGTAIILFGTSFGPPFLLDTFGIKGNLWLTDGLLGQLHSMPLDATGEGIDAPAWMGLGMLHRFGGTNAFVHFQAVTYTAALCNVRSSNGAATRLF